MAHDSKCVFVFARKVEIYFNVGNTLDENSTNNDEDHKNRTCSWESMNWMRASKGLPFTTGEFRYLIVYPIYKRDMLIQRVANIGIIKAEESAVVD